GAHAQQPARPGIAPAGDAPRSRRRAYLIAGRADLAVAVGREPGGRRERARLLADERTVGGEAAAAVMGGRETDERPGEIDLPPGRVLALDRAGPRDHAALHVVGDDPG